MNNTTNNTNQTKKFNLMTYVYGQVYKEYLLCGKKEEFTIKNLKAQTWEYVLRKLKSENKITDFELGSTFETACEVKITGFSEKDMWYKAYLEAIRKNLEREVA